MWFIEPNVPLSLFQLFIRAANKCLSTVDVSLLYLLGDIKWSLTKKGLFEYKVSVGLIMLTVYN